MAHYLVIDGFPPYDGRYPMIYVEELKNRELGVIRRHVGYMPATIDEGLIGADAELIAMLAVLAIHRAERIDASEIAGLYERFGEAIFWSKIRIEADPESAEDDAGPPAGNSNGSEPSSGDASPTSSATSEPATPPAFGNPGSDTSLSAPATWAN